MGSNTAIVPIFPLYLVLFPRQLLPLRIFEPRYKQMLDDILQGDKQFGICLVDRSRSVLGWEAPHPVGTIAKVSKLEDLDVMGQNTYIETIGRQRFRILRIIEPEHARPANYNPFDSVGGLEKEKEMSQAKTNAWHQSVHAQDETKKIGSKQHDSTLNDMPKGNNNDSNNNNNIDDDTDDDSADQKPYLRAEVKFMPEIDENVAFEDWNKLVSLWKEKIRRLSKPREISDHELDHVLQNYDLLTEAPTMDFVYSLAALGAKEPEDLQPILEADTLQDVFSKVEYLFQGDK